ncbi:hypothetical protein O6P43_029493 [Quillaja saponaria]|uniref:Uncharacterized protein n=1 Tax=Quillaja saponaria TaxID=32244 RepID=A0AAD7L0D6_QUISA|nr:hypothetical protein O6P43_029493 [Quillaja saponaria]
MALFSVLSSCFVPSSSSSRVSDDAGSSKLKALSSEKSKNTKAKSSGAPIVASYFPVNSYISRFFCQLLHPLKSSSSSSHFYDEGAESPIKEHSSAIQNQNQMEQKLQ